MLFTIMNIDCEEHVWKKDLRVVYKNILRKEVHIPVDVEVSSVLCTAICSLHCERNICSLCSFPSIQVSLLIYEYSGMKECGFVQVSRG